MLYAVNLFSDPPKVPCWELDQPNSYLCNEDASIRHCQLICEGLYHQTEGYEENLS